MSWEDWEAYYYGDYDRYYQESEQENNPQKPSHLYLIDGDNHITEATKRIKLADETDDVRIFVSQDELYKKYTKKNLPHVTVIKVEPGDQAVDNRIKSVLGNAVKDDYEEVYVISHDKGYDKKIQNYRSKYHKKKDQLDRRELF